MNSSNYIIVTYSSDIESKGTATLMAHIDPVFNLRYLENMEVVLYYKGYQMIELFILLQLIQVLTPGSNLSIFYEEKKWGRDAYVYFT